VTDTACITRQVIFIEVKLFDLDYRYSYWMNIRFSYGFFVVVKFANVIIPENIFRAMWVKEMGDMLDLLPYYLLVCLPVFIALSPINPVEAASGKQFVDGLVPYVPALILLTNSPSVDIPPKVLNCELIISVRDHYRIGIGHGVFCLEIINFYAGLWIRIRPDPKLFACSDPDP
jgi:hypothetical protein